MNEIVDIRLPSFTPGHIRKVPEHHRNARTLGTPVDNKINTEEVLISFEDP